MMDQSGAVIKVSQKGDYVPDTSAMAYPLGSCRTCGCVELTPRRTTAAQHTCQVVRVSKSVVRGHLEQDNHHHGLAERSFVRTSAGLGQDPAVVSLRQRPTEGAKSARLQLLELWL
eukprot:3937469-Rhodomonas_salina.1